MLGYKLIKETEYEKFVNTIEWYKQLKDRTQDLKKMFRDFLYNKRIKVKAGKRKIEVTSINWREPLKIGDTFWTKQGVFYWNGTKLFLLSTNLNLGKLN